MAGYARKIIIGLLSAGLLWYVLKDVAFAELSQQFRRARYGWLLLVGLSMLLTYGLRALRWRLLLQSAGYHPPVFRATVAILAGTLAGLAFPGAGELTRCETLRRTDRVPLALSLGSVVAERVVDLLMLGALVGLTLLLEFARLWTYFADTVGERLLRFWYVLPLTALLLAGGWQLLRRLLRPSPPAAQPSRVQNAVRGLNEGLRTVRQLRQPGLFWGLSALGYGLAFLTTYAAFLTSPLLRSLTPLAALTVLALTSLGGLAVPTQGGVGTYHALASVGLRFYGFSLTDSVTAATFLHAIIVGTALLFSLGGFLLAPVLALRHKASHISVTDA